MTVDSLSSPPTTFNKLLITDIMCGVISLITAFGETRLALGYQ